MPSPRCTDAEFVELWRTHKSARTVAEALKMGLRDVHARRRRVEQRLNVRLEADSPQAEHYKHLHPVEHNARRHVEVRDGVVLVFSDAHFWPGVRTTAFRALLQFCRDLKPRAVICNGDAFDGASISRFPRIGWDSKPTVIEELRACRDSLHLIEDAAKGSRLIWPLGNHDSRFENRLAMNAPEYEGVQGFSLKDHFPQWEPCWSAWINGETVVKHRYKGGIHATYNNTVHSGKNIITGHLHSLRVTAFDDYNGTRFGVDTGTLADTTGPQFVDYLEDSPVNWRSGFVVLTFHKGQLLWPEVVHVVGPGEISFRGKIMAV